jgi:predicted NodU family carbamoyl transferase
VDGSARVQVVRREGNERFWDLIAEFGRLRGVPAVLNTSLNGPDEPIACTPADALRIFVSTGLDAIVLEDYLVCRRDVTAAAPTRETGVPVA